MLKLESLIDPSDIQSRYMQHYSKQEKVQVVYQEADTTHGHVVKDEAEEIQLNKKRKVLLEDEPSDSEEEIVVDDDDIPLSKTHAHDNEDIVGDHGNNTCENSTSCNSETKKGIVNDNEDKSKSAIKGDHVKIGSERSAFSRPDMSEVHGMANGRLPFTSERLTQGNMDLHGGLINMDLVTNPILRAMEGHILDPHQRLQAANYWLHISRLHQTSQSLYQGLLSPHPLVAPPNLITGLHFPQHLHAYHQRLGLVSNSHSLHTKTPSTTSPSSTYTRLADNSSDNVSQSDSPVTPEGSSSKRTASGSPASESDSPRSQRLDSSMGSTSSGTDHLDSPQHGMLHVGHVGHAPILPLTPHQTTYMHPALPGFAGPGRRPRDPSKPPPLKKYKCDLCGKAFSRSNTLVTHRRIHTGEKPFACDTCGRAFRQPGNLTRHRLTHTSHKPYVCPVCKKAFNRASNLQTHMRTHSNVRPYACSCCGKNFQQSVDLKVHMYSHAGMQPEPFPKMTA